MRENDGRQAEAKFRSAEEKIRHSDDEERGHREGSHREGTKRGCPGSGVENSEGEADEEAYEKAEAGLKNGEGCDREEVGWQGVGEVDALKNAGEGIGGEKDEDERRAGACESEVARREGARITVVAGGFFITHAPSITDRAFFLNSVLDVVFSANASCYR